MRIGTILITQTGLIGAVLRQEGSGLAVQNIFHSIQDSSNEAEMVLQPGEFHRLKDDYAIKTLIEAHDLKSIPNFGKPLPNPNKANLDALAAEIHAGLGDLVGEEDESGLEGEGTDEDDEDDEEGANF